jgi:hypoxanthine phosphoribosyltransferase
MEKLIDSDSIQQRVLELAQAISIDHVQSDNVLPPVLICVLNGSIHFFSDLTRMMSIECEIDFLRLKSYSGQDNSGGVQCLKELELDLKGKRVYIVDDICDTGETLIEALIKVNSRMPADVKVVTLLRRSTSPVTTDFCGFEIGDEWVYGYGLDNNGLARGLKDIHKI